jgi:hypothetical protein
MEKRGSEAGQPRRAASKDKNKCQENGVWSLRVVVACRCRGGNGLRRGEAWSGYSCIGLVEWDLMIERIDTPADGSCCVGKQPLVAGQAGAEHRVR